MPQKYEQQRLNNRIKGGIEQSNSASSQPPTCFAFLSHIVTMDGEALRWMARHTHDTATTCTVHPQETTFLTSR